MPPLRLASWTALGLAGAALAWMQWGPGPTPTAGPPPRHPADPGFPRRVDLGPGRSIELPAAPRRIVVANTALVDTVLALVPAERIVALPRQAATWSAALRGHEAAEQIPTFAEFVAENVLARDPDLVLCSVHSQPETVAALRRVGVPLVRFDFPPDLAAVRTQLRLCASLLGAEERLAAVEAGLDARIAALAAAPGPRRGVRAAFYAHDGNEGWSSGRGTPAEEMLGLAGLRNAVGEAGHRGPSRLTFEQLLAVDPDLLVIPLAHGEVDRATEQALAGPLAVLRAVREGQVVRLHPGLFATTSHELVTAAEELARAADLVLAEPAGEDRR
jgi:iron complex transport system substrate-binding protein